MPASHSLLHSMTSLLLVLILTSMASAAAAVAATSRRGVALVTGATDGIGQLTSSLLARDGFRVLLHGRSHERLEATRQAILKQTPSAELDAFCYDLSSLSQTKQFANSVIEKYGDKLDVLVQNAGVFSPRKLITSDGLETTFQVNVAAPFILTCLLLPTLKKTPNSRMLMVSSISQSDGGQLDFNNLQSEKEFSQYTSYGASKLCMAMMAQELSSRFGPEECAVVSCDPGTVNTKILLAGWGRCGIEVKDASDEYNLVREFDGTRHGKYYVSLRESRCSADAYDVEKRRRLVGVLEGITGCKL